MINPRLLKSGRTKQFDPHVVGGKYYRPRVQLGQRLFHCKRIFKRASEALTYSGAVIERWMRLYDAAMHDERMDAMHELDADRALTEVQA